MPRDRKVYRLGIYEESDVGNLWRGLDGEYFDRARTAYPDHDRVISVARSLLAMNKKDHRILMTKCKRIIESKPHYSRNRLFLINSEELETIQVERTKTEPYGPFGLFQRTVHENVRVPNPEFNKLNKYLNGKSYIILIDDRDVEQRDDIIKEWDKVILLTDSGRFVEASYDVRWFNYCKLDSAKIEEVKEIEQLGIEVNILMSGMICTYINPEELQAIL